MTATLSGSTFTLSGTGLVAGDYYVAAYDRANGKGVSDRLLLSVLAGKYALTVTGGGSFEENATVRITANSPTTGKVFDKWTTADGVIFADATAATTTITMSAKTVTVTATYKDAPVTTTYTITFDANGGSVSPANTTYSSLNELNLALFQYIEGYYNKKRPHSANDMLSPDEKESSFLSNNLNLTNQ